MAVDRQTRDLLALFKLPAGTEVNATTDLDIVSAREAARTMWCDFAGERPGAIEVTNIEVAGANGSIPARLYRAENAPSGALPVVVFFHGGGWSLGDLDCYEGLMRTVCEYSGALLISVAYRLAPEHRFPAGLEDGLAAVKWVVRNAARLGGDAKRLAVMGDSAGGNLATVVARKLRGDIRLAAQFLLYPVLDVSRPHQAYPSRMAFGDGDYLLTRQNIDDTVSWYLGTGERTEEPDISPLRAENLGDLPPTVLITAGHDPLKDEAAAYAKRLQSAGVAVELRCFESTIHAFLSFGELDIAEHGRRYLAARIREML